MEQNDPATESTQLPRWLPNGDIEDEWGVIPELPQHQRDPITGKAVEESSELKAHRREVMDRFLRALTLLPDDNPPGADEEIARIFGHG